MRHSRNPFWHTDEVDQLKPELGHGTHCFRNRRCVLIFALHGKHCTRNDLHSYDGHLRLHIHSSLTGRNSVPSSKQLLRFFHHQRCEPFDCLQAECRSGQPALLTPELTFARKHGLFAQRRFQQQTRHQSLLIVLSIFQQDMLNDFRIRCHRGNAHASSSELKLFAFHPLKIANRVIDTKSASFK